MSLPVSSSSLQVRGVSELTRKRSLVARSFLSRGDDRNSDLAGVDIVSWSLRSDRHGRPSGEGGMMHRVGSRPSAFSPC